MTGGGLLTGDPLDRSHPLANGLVSFWLPLPHLQGSLLFDYAGRNHGTLTNGPTWGTGADPRFGAVTYPGSNVIYTQTAANFTTPAAYTWMAALNSTEASGTTGTLGENYPFLIDGVNLSAGFVWVHPDSTFPFCAVHRLSGGSYVRTQYATGGVANRWYHVVGTWDGATVRLYVNGAEVASNAAASILAFSTSTVRSGWRWPGRISERAVWYRALSASEVGRLYDQSARGFPDLIRRTRRRRAAFQGSSPPPPPSYFLPAVAGLGW